ECGSLTLSSSSSYREQQSMIMKFSSRSVPKSASNGNNTEPSKRLIIHSPIIIRQAPSPPPLPFIQLFRRSMDIEAANKKQELINGFQNLINEKDKRIEALINEKKENEKKYQEDITKLTNEIQKLQKQLVVIPQSNTPGINNYLRLMGGVPGIYKCLTIVSGALLSTIYRRCK
ncbi:unnamed protein product, partial [Rotaria sp. Silwood2]